MSVSASKRKRSIREPRTRVQWANDSSLYYRLRDAVICFARGAKRWRDRAEYAFRQLRPIQAHDFPAELQSTFEEIIALRNEATLTFPHTKILSADVLSPKKREQLTSAFFNLYEDMTKERAKIGL